VRPALARSKGEKKGFDLIREERKEKSKVEFFSPVEELFGRGGKRGRRESSAILCQKKKKANSSVWGCRGNRARKKKRRRKGRCAPVIFVRIRVRGGGEKKKGIGTPAGRMTEKKGKRFRCTSSGTGRGKNQREKKTKSDLPGEKEEGGDSQKFHLQVRWGEEGKKREDALF